MIHLPLGISNAHSAELDATRYLLKGQNAPFDGYLVVPKRLEKALVAIADLESTKELLNVKTQYYEEKIKIEKLATDARLSAKQAESEAVEKELKAKIASLDVWYKKPWVVATGVAVLFIATGVLAP